MIDLSAIINNQYIIPIIVFVAFFIFSRIISFVIKKYIVNIAKKTKTDLDDIVVGITSKPIINIIVLIGLFLSLKLIPALERFRDAIDKVFFVVFVLLLTFMLSKLLSVLISRWLRVKKKFEKTPILISRVISVTVFLIAIIIVLGYFNIEISPLIATLGLGGLAVGLALQNTLSNFFAGLHIISDKPLTVGDHVRLPDADLSGYVEDIGWRSTKIRTLPNTIVVVPNAKLAESILINDFLPEKQMAVLVQCGVDYSSDLKKVEKVTTEVAKKIQKTVEGAVRDFIPFIRYHTFAESNINFTVILRAEKFVDKYLITHEFIKALKQRYDKEKIEISWPIRKIKNFK